MNDLYLGFLVASGGGEFGLYNLYHNVSCFAAVKCHFAHDGRAHTLIRTEVIRYCPTTVLGRKSAGAL